MFVGVFQIALMGVGMRVGLPIVTVVVLVFDVLVIMQGVRVGMRLISVCVLMRVRRGQCGCPRCRSSHFLLSARALSDLIGPR